MPPAIDQSYLDFELDASLSKSPLRGSISGHMRDVLNARSGSEIRP